MMAMMMSAQAVLFAAPFCIQHTRSISKESPSSSCYNPSKRCILPSSSSLSSSSSFFLIKHTTVVTAITRKHSVVNENKTPVSMRLRAVENYNADFTLPPEVQQKLFAFLKQPLFAKEVAENASCKSTEFAEILFQPVPFSRSTPRGMPREYEWYLDNPRYTIINVPPTFMFKAKCFKPSRLCAIFRRLGLSEEEICFGEKKKDEKKEEIQLKENKMNSQQRKFDNNDDENNNDPWRGFGHSMKQILQESETGIYDDGDDDDLDQYVV